MDLNITEISKQTVACSQFFAGRDDLIIEALPARSQGGTFLLQCEVLSWNEQLALSVLQANSAV
jgi:hypothetical protein